MQIPKEYPTKVIEKNKIAEETYEVKFSRPSDFEYQAGQYVIVKINTKMPKGMAPVRALSLSSSPNDKKVLSVCFRYEDEPTHFKKNLIEKETDVIIRGPLGKFTLPDNQNKPIIMIAGGVGIVPYVGMLRYLTENKSNQKIKLIYTDKSRERMAYLKELEGLIKKNKNLKLVTQLKRVDEELLIDQCNLKDSIFYVCGKPDLVENIVYILKELKIPEERIIMEKY